MRFDQPDPGDSEASRYGRDASQPAAAPGEPEPAASPEEQVTAQVRYREIVEVRYQQAWAEAVPRLRAAWADHQDRYPERTQAAPRTEADGTWIGGEHRRLDPEQNAEASKAHADLADEASRHFLPVLLRLEAASPHRRLAGVEHLVKGEDRLKEKLADAWQGRPGLTARQVLGLIPDAVRSTLEYSAEGYAKGVVADVEQLKEEGLELLKLKNLWDGDQYKGINSQWRRAETGTRFEMQFRTPESLEAKELTHEAYERIRANAALPVDEQDLTEQRVLDGFQRRVNALIVTPPGTNRIKDFPERTNG